MNCKLLSLIEVLGRVRSRKVEKSQIGVKAHLEQLAVFLFGL